MPGTLVSLHAHPDDECIATGGVIAQAAAAGHRVVLVVATGGEVGEVADGFLDPGETLFERRVRETETAAEILGIARIEWLGYRDSGMVDTDDNHAEGSFWSADVEEVAARVAAILREEDAEVLTIYDENGNYGHPDHIQVHRVGARAGELAATPRVYEATMNRDHIQTIARERYDELRTNGAEIPEGIEDPDDITMGLPASQITTAVDVSEFVVTKRNALAAHASQVDETSFFLAMPDEAFAAVFGTEWFVRRGAPPGTREDSLFPDEHPE
ncbi:MAG TPA: PIG-L family deacetylase [Acidimicrobiia bacterium]|nr:PIG-L family deacetylase [Acidimicrobiia bacterium]